MTNQITAVSHTVAVEEKADWELSDVISLFRFLLNKEMPSMRLPRASLLRREQQNGTHYFSFRDHLGSVRELVNGRGSVVTEITYEPYGVMTVSGSVEPSVGFAVDRRFPPDCGHMSQGVLSRVWGLRGCIGIKVVV